MAMSETTLATELKAMGLYDTEEAAAAAWADAFSTYFEDAEAGIAPGPTAGTISALALPAAKTAMEDILAGPTTEALDGMSEPNQAASKIQSAISAYWAALVPGTAWVVTPPAGPCTLITAPTLLSGLAATLSGIFVTNTGPPAKTKDQAMDAIANAIHSANSGGVATFPPTAGGGLGPLPII